MGEQGKALVLHARHAEFGAKFVPFAGYQMPMNYAGGIMEEHHTVRKAVGVFDVSHMGNFFITGPDAVRAVDAIVTNDISSLAVGHAAYTVMCNDDGGIIDDLIVYKLAADHVLLVVNASRRAIDAAHIEAHLQGQASFADRSDDYVLLAVQGPQAAALLATLVRDDLAPVPSFGVIEATSHSGLALMMARTGYTGEDGFEVLIANADAPAFFTDLCAAGESFGLKPIGLGARDTLRLEAKFPLYGNDISLETNPLEAGLAWVVKLNKAVPFVGQAALQTIKARGLTRRLRGVVMEARGVLRPGYTLYAGDVAIGTLTSGTMSPSLGHAVGMAYVAIAHADAKEGIEVDIRGKRQPVRLTTRAFYQRSA